MGKKVAFKKEERKKASDADCVTIAAQVRKYGILKLARAIGCSYSTVNQKINGTQWLYADEVRFWRNVMSGKV
jgi:hypothetical protein